MKFFKCIGIVLIGFYSAVFAAAVPNDVAIEAIQTTLKKVFQDVPLKVQVDISSQSLVDGMRNAGDQINVNTDTFFTQLGKSLPKAGPGIEALGAAGGNALVPMRNQILIGIGCGVAITVIGILIKEFVSKYITRYLFEPQLIAEKYSQGICGRITEWFTGRKPVDLIKHMVVSDELKEQLDFVIAMTINVKKYGGQFDNVLLAGAPGTGKTLFAQLLAKNCGMDYAIIPAANVSQFLANGRAVEELNNLFEWAARSRNGVIIFFDEAETFLANRNTLSNDAQNALNCFLAHTGTPSDKIMIICATNRPEILDDAVKSRFGTKIKFPLPDESARHNQLLMNIKKTFGKQHGAKVNYACLKDEACIATIAQKTEGWSGRMLQKFVNRLRQQALARGKLVIEPTDIDDLIAYMQNSIGEFGSD